MSITPVAPQLTPFVDAEKAVLQLLADLVAAHCIDTETPKDLASRLPFIRVESLGGQSTQWEDSPRIDVDVFGPRLTRSVGWDLVRACQARLLSFPHLIPGVGVIDSVSVDGDPNETPWQNTQIRHFTSSYKVTVRR